MQSRNIAAALLCYLTTAMAHADATSGPFQIHGIGIDETEKLSSTIVPDPDHDAYYLYEPKDIGDRIQQVIVNRADIPYNTQITAVHYRPVMARTVYDGLINPLGPEIPFAWHSLPIPQSSESLVLDLQKLPTKDDSRTLTKSDYAVMRSDKNADGDLKAKLDQCMAGTIPTKRPGDLSCGFGHIADEFRTTLGSGKRLFLRINYPLNC